MSKAAILTAILGLTIINAFSQKNLQPGYIVLNNNDTIHGFINYRQWGKNPSVIEFTPSPSEGTKRYTRNEINYFEILGKESYRKYSVTISLDPNRINDISDKNTNAKTDEVFLKQLHAGKNVSLFSYEDEIKLRYFILTDNQSVPEELKNSVYIFNGTVVNEKEYLMQLRAIAAKYMPADAELAWLINNNGYSEKKLLKVCYHLNEILEDEKVGYKGKKPVIFFIGGGIDRYSSSFSGDIKYSGSKSSSTSPMLIAGIYIIFNPEIEKFYLQNTISYSIGYKTKATSIQEYYEATSDYRYELKYNVFSFNSQIIWNIYSKPDCKVFSGGGIAANFSSYQTNKQTYYRHSNLNNSTTVSHIDDYLLLSKFWLCFSTSAGITLKNINATINYMPAVGINKDKSYLLKTSNLQIRFTYLLRKKDH